MAILLSLGFWQLDRLAWKEGILDALQTQMNRDPRKDMLGLGGHDIKEFSRGRINGHFIDTAPVFIGPRTHNEQSGYHILQPFKTIDGKTVIVNRGWVAADMRATSIPHSNAPYVGGYLMRPVPSSMTPDNRPDIGLWYWADIKALEEFYGIKTIGYVLYQETGANDIPKPFNGLPVPRNKHRQYALFWFGMAGLLPLLFWFSSRRSKTA